MALVKNYKTDKQRLIDSLKILMACRDAVERLYQEWLIIKKFGFFILSATKVQSLHIGQNLQLTCFSKLASRKFENTKKHNF